MNNVLDAAFSWAEANMSKDSPHASAIQAYIAGYHANQGWRSFWCGVSVGVSISVFIFAHWT